MTKHPDTIQINGEYYRLGVDIALSIGKDMHCMDVVCKSIICHDPVEGFYLKSGGILIAMEGSSFNDFWTDTPANRKKLRAHCRATRAEYERGVQRQLLEIRQRNATN